MQDIINPILQKNLQALFQQDEILAARLFAMDKQDKFDVFIGQKDPIDINIIDPKTLKYIYENPVKDTKENLENFEKKYKRYPVLYFYGLGNGVFYKGLLHNKSHKKIIVIEPNLEIIFIVLSLMDLSTELANERLMLFYSKFADYTQFYYLVSKQELTIFAKIYDLHIHSPFYDQYSSDYRRINQDFAKAIAQMVAGHGNSIDDVLQGVRQHIENLPAMINNYAYKDLAKKRLRKNDTAIIVATGPSLDKQLDILKEYVPYASIISLDASYPILAKHGIKPDYVTSIERVKETASFFEKEYPDIDENIYFIVASLTHEQSIKNLKNRRLVLTIRPQQSETIFKLHRYGYLGIGHSTANQAYQLAYALGHKNIVLIGQDLAFSKDGKSHATGHAFIQDEENLFCKAYGGKGKVRTTYVWEKFKNQYEADIVQSQKEGVVTYNCTEGGARINGAIEKPFLATMKKLCKDKKPKFMPNIKKLSIAAANKDLLKAYYFISKKVKGELEMKLKIEAAFLKIVPKIDNLLQAEKKYTKLIFNKLVSLTSKIDKIKSSLVSNKYNKYVENILSISVFYQELELAKISVAPSDELNEKIDKLLEWVEIHKYWLFSVAGGLNADIDTSLKASKNLLVELKIRNILPNDGLLAMEWEKYGYEIYRNTNYES